MLTPKGPQLAVHFAVRAVELTARRRLFSACHVNHLHVIEDIFTFDDIIRQVVLANWHRRSKRDR